MTLEYLIHPASWLSSNPILLLLLTQFLAGCTPNPRANLKILNATSTEVRITAIEVNRKRKASDEILVPAMTAQKFSDKGFVANLLLAGGETLSLSVEYEGKSLNASCLLPPHPDGVCLVKARYTGTSELTCAYDCADASSK